MTFAVFSGQHLGLGSQTLPEPAFECFSDHNGVFARHVACGTMTTWKFGFAT